MTQTPDFDVLDFSRMLARLPEHTPISDDFEEVNPQERGVWYSSQRQHMAGWFQAQATKGSGAYSRDEPNRSARRTWQRLASPGGMIWIAEALGVPDETLKQAVADVRAEPEKRRRCGIIRRHIPWEMIAPLASKHTRRPKPRFLAE